MGRWWSGDTDPEPDWVEDTSSDISGDDASGDDSGGD